ncbi:MAG: SocA family protein [Bacteroides sp.]|nr:SocA family protein [Bacteroides sp.]
MSLGVTVNRVKTGALLAYIANKVPEINMRKMLKIVYLIDERFMQLRGFPFTWLDYYVWEKGPVAPEIYSLKNQDNHFSDFVKATKSEDGKFIIHPLIPINCDPAGPFGELSEYDLSIIDEELSKYGDKSADWLTDQTHLPDTLWTKTKSEYKVEFKDGKSDCRIDLTELIKNDEDLREVYEDAKWNIGFQAQLNSQI